MKAAPVPRQSRTHWDTTCRLASNRPHTPLLWVSACSRSPAYAGKPGQAVRVRSYLEAISDGQSRPLIKLVRRLGGHVSCCGSSG